MNAEGEILQFELKSLVDGQEVTPSTIGYTDFLHFTEEVAKFIRGSEASSVLDEVHVEIVEGSFAVKTVLLGAIARSVHADYEKLQHGDVLRGMDKNRAEVVSKWQRRAQKDPNYSVLILPRKDADTHPLKISSETDFRDADEEIWVQVERYVTGKVYSQGGKNRVNIHLTLQGSNDDMILDTTQEYLRNQNIKMYDTLQVRIQAKENQQTGELKDRKLLEIIGTEAFYDEDELNAFIEKGTKVWADVDDISAWVAEQRGAL